MKKLNLYKNSIFTPTKLSTKIYFLLAICGFLLIWLGTINFHNYLNSKLFIACSKSKNICNITRYQHPNIYQKFNFKISDLQSITDKTDSKIEFCFKSEPCKAIYTGSTGRGGFAREYIKDFNNKLNTESDFKILPSKYPNDIVMFIIGYGYMYIVSILLFYSFFVTGFLGIIKLDIEKNRLIKTKIAFFFNITTEYNLDDLISVNMVEFNKNNKLKKLILRFKDQEERFTLLSDENKANELINIAKQNLQKCLIGSPTKHKLID